MMKNYRFDRDSMFLLRIRQGLSFRVLSKKSKLCITTLWKMESGRLKRPSPETLAKLARGLGVDPMVLMRGGKNGESKRKAAR